MIGEAALTMASMIIDLAMFLLVLFVLVPVMMVFAISMRDFIYHNHNRKHAERHNEAAGNSLGSGSPTPATIHLNKPMV